MLNLRPYQKDAVRAVIDARERGRQRVIYCAPTGTGKTQIFCGIHQQLEGRTLVLAHREELLDQAAARFRGMDPDLAADVEQADRWAARGADVICASVQTLARGNRLDWFQPGTVIVDEAHHAVADSYRNVLERFQCFDREGPLLVGCTATPKRLDGVSLHQIFEEQVFTYSILDAMRDEWLAPIRAYQVKTKVDLSGVRNVAGDFNQGQLEKAVDTEVRTEQVVERWVEVAANRPTVVFCVTVDHAKNAARTWREFGVAAEHIDGTMSGDVRRAVLERFKSGQTQVLTNVEVLTEGFDHPPTSCIVMLRPTQSWALYVQMVGRGTRGGGKCPVPGKKDLVVIDVVDACTTHDLASVPSILDLPAGMDLEGHSLQEAAELLEQLEDKGLGDFKPANFSELETVLKKVDLFKQASPTPQVMPYSDLAWVRMLGDTFALNCGDKRRAHLYRDLLGAWKLQLTQPGKPAQVYALAPLCDAGMAVRQADRTILQAWPDAVRVAKANARWRSLPASDRQLEILRRAGYPESRLTGLSKGEASSMIDQAFSTRRGRSYRGAA